MMTVRFLCIVPYHCNYAYVKFVAGAGDQVTIGNASDIGSTVTGGNQQSVFVNISSGTHM